MPIILQHFNKAKLLIAGEGPMRGELEQLVKELNLNNVVSFLGTYKQVKELLITSDVFVLPSLSEGMPGALLEAAALEKPCVASDLESIREIVENGESGLLVMPGSPQDIAQAVIWLVCNKKKSHEMGRNARDNIMNNFLIDKTIKKLESVYTQILGS
jgi:glycosyltransferase involved in cell wall biosynthesis